ncbi:probable disease resistance protein At1g61300 [Malus domestica]|uniref:probable disease resistance protein At1g61300 n=1 Tax=Malus domestica TaxID=3750 RepID=UPI003975DB70
MAMDILTAIIPTIIDYTVRPVGSQIRGGVGKTTLAKEVYREAVKEKFFDDVVIILNVKEKTSNEKIQKEITKKLRMDVNESEDMETRANVLRARIKEGKPRVILDDVLERIDFEAVGFVGVPNYNRILKEATQLAKKCGGLPVLVVAVASALRESSLEEWKYALRSFKRFDKKESNEKAFLALKWSYEQLEDRELKQLFLLCGVIAGRSCEVHLIRMHELVRDVAVRMAN